MSAPTYLLSNLDFELTWSRHGTSDRALPRQVLDHCERFASILRLLYPQGEPLSPSSPLPQPPVPGARLIPWGITSTVANQADDAGWSLAGPALSTVQEVNSKLFSHALERQAGLQSAGATVVSSEEELIRAAGALPGPWILKDPWGVSGRGQIRGQGKPDDATGRRARRLLARAEALLLEPLIGDVEEFSFHFDIKDDGRWSLLGACALLSSAEGTFRGLRPLSSTSEAPEALRAGAEVAAGAAAHAGYFGPLSVDTLRGTYDGSTVERGILEINGRHTFGRLALSLAERLDHPAGLTWHHPPQGAPWPAQAQPLPDDADPGSASGTYFTLS